LGADKVTAFTNDPKRGDVELDDRDFDDLGIGIARSEPVRAVHFVIEIER
jgi:hypothetical protein